MSTANSPVGSLDHNSAYPMALKNALATTASNCVPAFFLISTKASVWLIPGLYGLFAIMIPVYAFVLVAVVRHGHLPEHLARPGDGPKQSGCD